MITIGQIAGALNRFAPEALQEDYDNSGLIIGTPDVECTGVLIAFDVTPEVVAEAAASGCNLIVAHHPLIFKGLKRLNGFSAIECAVIDAVRDGIAVYAGHTSFDNAPDGVSWQMARQLGLRDVEVLDPLSGRTEKLVVYVPSTHVAGVRDALFAAGAGHIGNYDSCSFASKGEGTFRALDGASPFVGNLGEVHREAEERLEVILPSWKHRSVEKALRSAHPYEEPAYDFYSTSGGADCHAGAGVVGNLETPVTVKVFSRLVKQTFGSPMLRCSAYSGMIGRVALCGGSGAFLASKAKRSGAHAFVTADVKYHDFADFAHELFLVDAGHFETEHCVTTIFYKIITEIFPNFAVRCAKSLSNPVKYM